VHQKQDTHNNHIAKEFDELLAGIRTDLFMKTGQNSQGTTRSMSKKHTQDFDSSAQLG
jgi:hypothetical protein